MFVFHINNEHINASTSTHEHSSRILYFYDLGFCNKSIVVSVNTMSIQKTDGFCTTTYLY